MKSNDLKSRYNNNSIIRKLNPEEAIPYTIDENGNKVEVEVLIDPVRVFDELLAMIGKEVEHD